MKALLAVQASARLSASLLSKRPSDPLKRKDVATMHCQHNRDRARNICTRRVTMPCGTTQWALMTSMDSLRTVLQNRSEEAREIEWHLKPEQQRLLQIGQHAAAIAQCLASGE